MATHHPIIMVVIKNNFETSSNKYQIVLIVINRDKILLHINALTHLRFDIEIDTAEFTQDRFNFVAVVIVITLD